MSFKSKIASFAFILITFIYSSKIGKDIWNAKIECTDFK